MKIPFKSYFKLFSKYLSKQKKDLIFLVILLVLSLGITLLNPQIIARFIDMAKDKKPARDLTIVAVIFMASALFQQVVVILTTYLSQNIGWRATNALREDLIDHCMNLDMTFHKSHKTGELIERLDGDVTSLFNFFANLFLNLINNIALLIGIIVLLFIKDYRIGIGLLIFTVIAMYILALFQKKAVPRWVKERQKSAEFFGFIGEQITSTEDIKSSGAISFVMYRFYQFIKEWLSVRSKAFIMYGYMWSVTLIIFAAGYAVAFSIGGYLFLNGIISIGSVFLIVNYTDLLNRPIEQIRSQLQELQKAGASIIRVEELFSLKSNLKDGNDYLLSSGSLSINLSNVSFKYEDGDNVLEDISFKLEKGKVLGLLGRTGSGKTTLSRLLVRFYDTTQGKIFYDNQYIKDIKINELRNNIAYVTQDVQLFAATVRNNLTFYNPNITDNDIFDAINSMGLEKWFEKLPNGLDTMLDALGASLSAGEAQLLSFIRVFLKNPKLVILDEASSRLDPITEQLIEQAINKLLVNRTCIIIAHRLKTIERADEILILENGKVIEHGNRVKLAKDCESRFYHLLKTGIEEVLA